jgi:hypothetical protein
MMKWLMVRGNKTLKIYASSVRPLKYMEQRLFDLKEKRDTDSTIVVDFTLLIQKRTDHPGRKSTRRQQS